MLLEPRIDQTQLILPCGNRIVVNSENMYKNQYFPHGASSYKICFQALKFNRRPGRFDRELFFSLPSPKDRLRILQINTQTWKPKPSKKVLLNLKNETAGFSGADLQSLCSAAFLRATVRCLRSLQPVSGVAKNGNETPPAPTPIEQGHFNSV